MQAKENITKKWMPGQEGKGLPCCICCSLNGKESSCNAGEQGSVCELARSPGQGNGKPLLHCCLKNPMHRSLVSSSPWGRGESDSTELLPLTQLSSEKASCLKRRKQTLNPAPLLANLYQMCNKVQVALPDGQTLPWGQL